MYCINAETHSVHTENDCSYTVITVPKQSKCVLKSQTNFHFNFNPEQSIYLEMNLPITFMRSGKILPHQQLCNTKVRDPNDMFINFATYTNKNIFNHVRKLFTRVNDNKNKESVISHMRKIIR